MDNWAVVIGIDRYWSKEVSLKGAVRDAEKVCEWLLSPDGGAVPESNLVFLASPLRGRKRPAGSVEANKDNITEGIAKLIRKSGGKGDRLFFYYAGHGLTAREDFSDKQALVASDFTDLLTDNSFDLDSLWEFFSATEFLDQFFFVDACRDPFPGEHRIGAWTLPQQRTPGQEQSQQFILYATSPLLKATELQAPGDERGAFTESLLQALSGTGSAKAWAAQDGCYAVRWDLLVDYVKTDFERRQLPVGEGFQMPQTTGTTGVFGRDRNPVLARFKAGAFPPQDLHVYLKPDGILPSAQVSVIDLSSFTPRETKSKLAALPVQFALPPNTYGVLAAAPEHQNAVAQPPVAVYEQVELTLELTPVDGAREGTAADRAAPPPPEPVRQGRTRAPRRSRKPVNLHVWSSDPLATIEITDYAGAHVRTADGTVDLKGVKPGFYRARLLTPEGEVHEQTVQLAPGENARLHLYAPPRAESKTAQRLVEAVGIKEGQDHTLDVSEKVGPVASAQLSTLLTVAAGLHLSGEARNTRMASLKMPALSRLVKPATQSAVYVLVGLDAGKARFAAGRLGRTKLRVWPFGKPVPRQASTPSALPKISGIGEYGLKTKPGPHWLSVGLPGGRTMVYSLAALPGRLTMVVVQQDLAGDVSVYQYLPALRPDDSTDPAFLRRLELMQRVYVGGRLELSGDSAIDLLKGKQMDPIAGCLGGYLLLRLGAIDKLVDAVNNMTAFYPGLSDSHVLRAEYEAARGHHDVAEQAAQRAIECGIPILMEGASLLLDYQINHPNAQLLAKMYDRRIPTSLWTGWIPGRLPAGRVLVP